MWKSALVLLIVAVSVGALMPAAQPAAADSDSVNQAILVSGPEPAAPAPESMQQASLGGTIALPRHDDGHFHADAEVNGTSIGFLVDTGATVVALTRADAERAGIAVDPSRFKIVAQGASGPVMGLPVVLHDVELGGHRLSDVPALVLAKGDQSLLGQNVLSQFQSVSIENDEMLLR